MQGNDRILLRVTAAIKRYGEVEAAMRRSFGSESDKKLFDPFSRIRQGLGIADRYSKMQICRD